MGCILGSIIKSIHLLEHFISTPIKGTKNNNIKDRQKINIEILYNCSLAINEKKKITKNPIITKIVCLKKKNKYWYPIYQRQLMM